MSLSPRRLAIVAFALAAGPSALAATKSPSAVKVTVTADKGVSELERLYVDRSIAVTLAKARCDVRPATPEEVPSIEARLQLHGWREGDVPGGEPVLDMQTGRDLPGHEREIEVRFTLEVKAAGRTEPVESHQRRFTVSRGTNRIQAYDPAKAARELALARLTDDLRRSVCSAAKSLERAAKSGAR
jgi:hypothetical protein